MNKELLRAKSLSESDPDESLRICNGVLNECFEGEDAQLALFISAYIMMQAERFGLAFNLYHRCAQLNPKQSEIWSNMGMCLEHHDPEQAKQYFSKAYQLDKKNYRALANMGLMLLQTGKPEKCLEVSKKALDINPSCPAAYHNQGLAKIMMKDWSGWGEWFKTLGVADRAARDYGKPDWNGEEGTVLVYGEQGVGDEIMYSSCLEDLLKRNSVILDCDSRLEGLFTRSYPEIQVYGDRFKTESRAADQDFDYQCAIGQLPYFFRRTGVFPGKPHITPDPERCIQWRALFDTFKGKKVGVAWRGGLNNTGEKKRSFSLEDMSNLFTEEDTFISLEYKPVDASEAKKHGVKCYHRATGKGGDIDDLAALVSQLDCVVTSCTTVVYVAGALGIPCYVLVPSKPSYRYHSKGDFPWYSSVKLVRQNPNEPWAEVVKRVKSIYRVRSKRSSRISRVVPLDNETLVRTG